MHYLLYEYRFSTGFCEEYRQENCLEINVSAGRGRDKILAALKYKIFKFQPNTRQIYDTQNTN